MTNSIPSMLTVVSTEVRTDKNGRNYNYLTVKGEEKSYITMPDGAVITAAQAAKQSATTAYALNYLEQPDFGFNLKKGDIALGQIVTKTVPAYELPDSQGTMRTVNTYSTVVFGDTRNPEAFEAEVRKAFARGGHALTAAPVVEAVTDFKG